MSRASRSRHQHSRDGPNDLSILILAFNERSTVEAAIPGALDAELSVAGREPIVVDHGSNDGTRELLREPEIAARVLRAGERIRERRSPTRPAVGTPGRSSPRSTVSACFARSYAAA